MIQINGRTVFNNSDLNNPDIDGGAIDGTAIGANSASTGAFTTLSASGQIKGVPTATAPIMFGNTTPVNTSTGATFPTATKTQISKASAFTDAAVGDLIIVTGGTGATTGQYRLTTKTSNDLVVVDRNIHAEGSDITDGAFTVYKDVVTVNNTDGVSGQMISGWGHTNEPLQIGGSSLFATSDVTQIVPTSRDVLVNGDLYIASATGTATVHIDSKFSRWAFTDDGGYDFIVKDVRLARNIIRINGAGDISGRVQIIPEQITAGAGTGITVVSNGNIAQQVYKVTTTYAAYTDSDLTKGIVIATLPAKTRLVAAYADTTVAYAGTDITAATLEVGITAEGAAEILATHNVFAAPIVVGDLDAEMGTAMTRAAKEQGAYMPSFTGTTAIYATIDATTGAATTLANLTAGSTTFYLITERLP